MGSINEALKRLFDTENIEDEDMFGKSAVKELLEDQDNIKLDNQDNNRRIH